MAESKSTKDEDFLYGTPTREQDEPLPQYETVTAESIEVMKLNFDEKQKARKDKHYSNTFWLFAGCILVLLIIFIIDVLVSVFLKGESSQVTNSIIEIIKTLLFTLSGYLFAKNEKVE